MVNMFGSQKFNKVLNLLPMDFPIQGGTLGPVYI